MARKKKRFRKAKWLAEYMLAMSLAGFVKLLPFRLASGLGGFLGELAYKLDKRHQIVIIENLQNSFKGITQDEIRKTGLSVYNNVGRHAVEFIQSGRYGRGGLEDRFSFVNYESYERAVAGGRGVLILTAHIGSWELMGLAQSIKRPPISFVVRPLDNPYLDRAVSRIRTRYGNSIINKKMGMKEILKTLKGGGSVAILLDQNVSRGEGVFVDFFGRPACTNRGLALIAARTKAPVIPAFIRRTGPDTHEIVIGEEVPLIDPGDREADVKANTQAYTKAIEDFARKYPDQWFWMHRRWKTRPEGTAHA